MKPFHSRTKIVATLGPASAKPDVLYSMFNAGLDVCRLNFSHGSQADHQEVLDTIRSINKKYNYKVSILPIYKAQKLELEQ